MTAPDAAAPHELRREIGLWSAIAVVVGSTIGSGIFRTPAGVADRLPGPIPMLGAWVAGGVFAVCGALTIAELASALPKTGGIYVFLREAWGKLAAFLFGWTQLIVIRAAALGAISITFAEYAFRVFGADPTTDANTMPVRFLAAGAIAVTAGFNVVGVRWGALVSNVTTVAKYGGLLFIVILAFALGLPQTGGAHYTTAAPAGSITISAFGLGLVSVLWAYDGWADLSYTAGEVKDPQRNLPRALLIGTGAVMAIYLAANLGYLAVLPIEQIRTSPLVAADVTNVLIGAAGVAFVGITVMLSTFGTLNNSLFTAPRVFFAAADDGLFPKAMASVHPRFHTPWISIMLCALLGIVFVLARTFEQLAEQYVIAYLPFYALGVGAIFILRRRPDYKPSFRAPLYPLVPVLFLTSVITLLIISVRDPAARTTTLAIFGVIAVGAIVYFVREKLRRS